jgi:hypothetical protein
MRRRSMLLIPVLVALSLGPVLADPIKVPEDYTTIQAAINNASSGAVISVWGPPPGQSSPPYTYRETLNFKGKNLVVASRCFLPGWTGCTPT